jgi:pimeloyl-ACP methyl ester carboxylesterase
MAAASIFIDFWSGEGTWDQTPERPKEAILLAIRDVARWGFALNNDTTPLSAFSQLKCPILYMLGSASPVPARAVADVLIPVLPNVQVLEFEGLGHMGPITHPTVVYDAIVAFLNRIA